MKYRRVRVALSLPYSCASVPIPPGVNLRSVHISHARTLLLGSLIAKEFGTEFHVRFDGPPREQGGGPVGDRGEPILDTLDCLKFLAIEPERVYWTEPDIPGEDWLRERLGNRYDLFDTIMHVSGICPEYYRAQIVDDVLVHAPSLIVRGMEFVDPARYYVAGPAAPTGGFHVPAENAVFAATGELKHELNVPMVVNNQAKMSKSLMNGVHWTTLTSASSELARKFLVATALHALDPLSALDWPFALNALEKRPYVWDWKTWGRLLRL